MAILTPQLSHTACQALCSRHYPQDLLDQIDALPVALLRSDAWVALFQGRRLCRLHSRFGEAGVLIHHALAEFRAKHDGEGELWAIAEEVVMCYHRREFGVGVALANAALGVAMRPYLQAELQFGRFLCLIGDERVLDALAAGEAALEPSYRLGTMATMLYREVETTLNPSDTLLCMSDGVIEALDAKRTLFGFERLEQTLSALPPTLDAHATLACVLNAVADHTGDQEQHDDLTLVVVRVQAGRAQPGEIPS